MASKRTSPRAFVKHPLVSCAVCVVLLVSGCASPGGSRTQRHHIVPVRPGEVAVVAEPGAVSPEEARARSRFAAAVAMDIEAQRLEELFTYQRMARGVRQPSLMRDARAFREEALQSLDEALEVDGGSPSILRKKGDVLLAMGRVEEAVLLYGRADASRLAEPRWYFRAAAQMEALGRLEDAARLLESLASASPPVSEEFRQIAWLELGDVYVKLERLGDAERVYRKALAVRRLNPRFAQTPVGAALANRLEEDPTGIRRMLVGVLTGRGKLDEALEEARLSLADAPNDPRALAVVAEVHGLRGEHSEAIEVAERFVEENPGNQIGVMTLMKALVDSGDVDGAVAKARAYLSLKGDDEQVRQAVVQIYRDAGRGDDAVRFVRPGGEEGEFPSYSVAMSLLNMYVKADEREKAFEFAEEILRENLLQPNVPLQVLGLLWRGLPTDEVGAFALDYSKRHPDDLTVSYAYARILTGNGRGSEAGPLYVEVAEKGIHFGDAYEAGADYLSDVGEHMRAIKLLLAGADNGFVAAPENSVQTIIDKAVERVALADELVRIADDYDAARVTLHEIVAGLYLESDVNDKAEEYYRKALEVPTPLMVDYAGLAIALYRQDRVDEAITLVETLRKRGRGTPPFIRMLVAMLSQDRRYEYAREIAARLIAERPTDIENRLSLVGVFVDEGDYASAEKELLTALDLAEGDDEALLKVRYMLGIAYDEQGKDEEAIAMWRANLEVNAADANSNNALGYHFADRGVNLDEAKALIEKALEDDADNAAFLDSLGWVYYKMGEMDLAVEYLERAARKQDDPVIYDHLGDALFETGEVAGALEAWQNALESHPLEKDRAAIERKIRENTSGGAGGDE